MPPSRFLATARTQSPRLGVVSLFAEVVRGARLNENAENGAPGGKGTACSGSDRRSGVVVVEGWPMPGSAAFVVTTRSREFQRIPLRSPGRKKTREAAVPYAASVR